MLQRRGEPPLPHAGGQEVGAIDFDILRFRIRRGLGDRFGPLRVRDGIVKPWVAAFDRVLRQRDHVLSSGVSGAIRSEGIDHPAFPQGRRNNHAATVAVPFDVLRCNDDDIHPLTHASRVVVPTAAATDAGRPRRRT